MKTLKLIFPVLLLCFLASCKSQKNKLIDEITQKEKTLVSTNQPIPEKNKVDELISLYKNFSEKYPKDSLSPEYLYKGATLLMNNENNEEAIVFIDKIINDYPKFGKLPEAVFLKAFIYENNIKNINKARETYQYFLNKFPNHDLVHDAKISLDNLGKTPEQIIKEFEMKQKQDSNKNTTAKIQ